MQLLWNCHQINVTDDKLTLIQVMAWSHQATSHYLSAGEKRRTFPMARPKCLMGNLTNLYRIYKAHQTNVWWTMKVFRQHCYLNQCWPRSMSPTRRMVSLGHNELTLTYHTNQDTYHKTHCGLVTYGLTEHDRHSSLVQVIPWSLFSARPLPKPTWASLLCPTHLFFRSSMRGGLLLCALSPIRVVVKALLVKGKTSPVASSRGRRSIRDRSAWRTRLEFWKRI